MTVYGELTGALGGGPHPSKVKLRLITHSSLQPLIIGALATFGVDAGIIDAPGHVVGRIVRDTDGKITGLELEPD